MFDLLSKRKSGAARSRRVLVRAQVEYLESRSMLAFASVAAEPVTEPMLTPSWVQAVPSDSSAMVAAGPVEFQLPEIDLDNLPLVPIPQPGNWPRGDWPPGMPDEGRTWEPPPSDDSQGSSDPGGMSGIDDLDNSNPDIFGDPSSKREKQAVIELLASLNFRPSKGIPEPNAEAADSPAQYEFWRASSAASGLHWQKTQTEGGMLSIAADAVAAELVERENLSTDKTEPLPEIPVRIDSTQGRFQVFEVSTTEEDQAAEDQAAEVSLDSTSEIATDVASLHMPIGRADAPPAASNHLTRAAIDPAFEEIPPADAQISLPAMAPATDEKVSRSWTAGGAVVAALAAIWVHRVQRAKRESRDLPEVPAEARMLSQQ